MLKAIRLTRSGLADDRVLYGLIGGYILIAGAIVVPAHHFFPKVFADYIGFLMVLDFGILPCLVFIALAVRSVVADPGRPTAWLRATVTRQRIGRLLSGYALLFALVPFMTTFSWLKSYIGLDGFRYDVALADLDRTLHFGVDPARILHAISYSQGVWRMLGFVYGPGWMLWVNGVVFWMACLSADRDLRRRFFLEYLFVWSVLGGLVAWLVISAGPVFYAEVTGDAQRFAPVMAAIAAHTEADGLGIRQLQTDLWNLYTSRTGGFGMGISAFPSLHLAMVTLSALTLSEINHLLGLLAWLVVAVVLYTSVVSAWHYAVDGYFSIAVMSLVHFALRRFTAARAP